MNMDHLFGGKRCERRPISISRVRFEGERIDFSLLNFLLFEIGSPRKSSAFEGPPGVDLLILLGIPVAQGFGLL
jgi:hypothetical protein